MKQLFTILLEDSGRTHNINAHTFTCLASNKEEAVGSMYFTRPDLYGRRVNRVSVDGVSVYEDAEFAKSIESATKLLDTLNKFSKGSRLRYQLDKIAGWQDGVEDEGEKLEVTKDFIKGDEFNQASDTWIIDIGEESYFYYNPEERDVDYKALLHFLDERSKKFVYKAGI